MVSRRDPRVDAYLAAMDPPLRRIAAAARAAVRRAAPSLLETVCMGVPHYRGRAWVCYLAEYSSHVNLGFHRGAFLRDPHHFLEGTGKGLRLVKLRSPADTQRPELAELIREAVERDRRTPGRKEGAAKPSGARGRAKGN